MLKKILYIMHVKWQVYLDQYWNQNQKHFEKSFYILKSLNFPEFLPLRLGAVPKSEPTGADSARKSTFSL